MMVGIHNPYPIVWPVERVRTLQWCRDNIQNERGLPYNHEAYPHLGAPGGPCDANDDPQVRTIIEQFATRLAKTFFGQCVFMKEAANNPAPGMFASSTEKLALEVIDRTYQMIDRCPPLAGQLPREDRRSGHEIEFDHCRIHVGWARSPSTLGDKNVKIGHGNELDKWERFSTSTEADPLNLFMDRSKDFPNYKYILESTPTVEDHSRVERLRLQSSNCAYWVPCPHCAKYQALKFARLRFDRDVVTNELDKDIARRTARYVCEHCEGEIFDQHRNAMMRLGVWVPEGCGVDHERALAVALESRRRLADGTFSQPENWPKRYWQQGYTTGEPKRDGPDAGYQLSSLYALRLTWGRIAAEWVAVQGDQYAIWNFVNQWLGETWRIQKRTESWEELGRRIIVDLDRGVAPLWSSLLTVGIDRQETFYVYDVVAWGPGRASHVVDYGTHEELSWIDRNVVRRVWAHADGGELLVARTLVDSGYDPAEPYHYSDRCLLERPMVVVLCCKGSSTPLGSPFRLGELDDKKLIPGLPLVMVDGWWTQPELNRRLARRPGMPGALSLFAGEVGEHKDWLRQVLNNELIRKKARGTSLRQSAVWDKVTDYPDDHRDAMRYADVAHLIWTDSKDVPTREQMLQPPPPRRKALSPLRTPDGRPLVPGREDD